jgi:hypothetical protein
MSIAVYVEPSERRQAVDVWKDKLTLEQIAEIHDDETDDIFIFEVHPNGIELKRNHTPTEEEQYAEQVRNEYDP